MRRKKVPEDLRSSSRDAAMLLQGVAHSGDHLRIHVRIGHEDVRLPFTSLQGETPP